MTESDESNAATLSQVAEQINLLFTEYNQLKEQERDRRVEAGVQLKNRRIAVGLKLIEARVRVDASGMAWQEWCAANIFRSQGDIRKVMKIAGADDPEAAAEAERASTRERVAAERARVQADVRAAAQQELEQAKPDPLPAAWTAQADQVIATPSAGPEPDPAQVPIIATGEVVAEQLADKPVKTAGPSLAQVNRRDDKINLMADTMRRSANVIRQCHDEYWTRSAKVHFLKCTETERDIVLDMLDDDERYWLKFAPAEELREAAE